MAIQNSLTRMAAYGSDLWNKAATGLAQVTSIVASIVYTDASAVEGLASTRSPVLRHISGQNTAPKPASKDITQYCYPQVKSCAFASPDHDHFHYTTESLSHTRGLQFLKPRINGPYFDLETIWDEHTYYEFADRSIEHTMSTMVQEPYVNHMPTVSF